MQTSRPANVYKRLIFFLKYYTRALTLYDVHPPRAFQFAQAVLEDNRQFYIFQEAEQLRQRLHHDQSRIRRTDFGRAEAEQETTVAQIVQKTAIRPYFARTLFRIANHLKCRTGIELGGGSGISTAYLGSAMQGPLYSLEGDPELAKLSQRNLQWLGIQSVQHRVGPFSQTLESTLEELPHPELVFLDGHHQSQPTLQYIQQILDKNPSQCLFILDDIYWSDDMATCWKQLRQDSRFWLSFDLFQLGILFYNSSPEGPKQHYTLVPRRWKPWRMGFFAQSPG